MYKIPPGGGGGSIASSRPKRGGIYFRSVIWLFVNNKVYIICIVVKCVI